MSVERKPLVIAMCTSELWEGVRCTHPAGHKGSHHRTTETGCELTWRTSRSDAPHLAPKPSPLSKFRFTTLGQ